MNKCKRTIAEIRKDLREATEAFRNRNKGPAKCPRWRYDQLRDRMYNLIDELNEREREFGTSLPKFDFYVDVEKSYELSSGGWMEPTAMYMADYREREE